MFKKVVIVVISLGVQAGETANAMIAGNVVDACWHASLLLVSLVLVMMVLQDEVKRVG